MKCKYCNKECKNTNSLVQHELRCKLNPNKISSLPTTGTAGYTWINNGILSKCVKKEDVESWIKLGWIRGMSELSKKKMSENYNQPNHGRAGTNEKEIERRKKISKAMKGNENWKYNKSHGRGKQGRYKGFWCDSSWELAFILYHLDHNLMIQRCTERRYYIFEGIEHTYIPDFITDDGIIEIKGFKTAQWLSKQKQNPDVIVLYESDMKPFIEYAVKTYGKYFWKELYEDKQTD